MFTSNLVIKFENNTVVDHPILLSNLQSIYPDIDYESLPQPYVKFQRVDKPVLGVFEKNILHEYKMLEDGIVRDSWTVVPVTAEEKQKIIDMHILNLDKPYPSWVFNEELLVYQAPVLPPIDAILAWQKNNLDKPKPDVTWNEENRQWDVVFPE